MAWFFFFFGGFNRDSSRNVRLCLNVASECLPEKANVCVAIGLRYLHLVQCPCDLRIVKPKCSDGTMSYTLFINEIFAVLE